MTAIRRDAIITHAAQNLLKDGYAVVRLSDLETTKLQQTLHAAKAFFQRSLQDKLSHGSAEAKWSHGFRPYGVEYSITPDRLDLNESFSLWSDRTDLVPNSDGVMDLLATCLDYRVSVVAPLVGGVLDEIIATKPFRCSAASPPRFERAAYLQINDCFDLSKTLPDQVARDLIQDKHEDAHMLTVLHATAPGLEIYPHDENGLEATEAMPMLPAENELIIMAGSVLTALTGGRVRPLYHRVRNHGIGGRQSIMYFVNPEIDEPLYSWVGGEEEGIDLRGRVRDAPLKYGLAPVDVL